MDSAFLLLNYLDNITELYFLIVSFLLFAGKTMLEMKDYDTMNSRKRVEIVWNTVWDATVFLFTHMLHCLLKIVFLMKQKHGCKQILRSERVLS